MAERAPVVVSYGTWESPITTDLLVTGAVRIQQVALDGEEIYWTEMRPQERGRYVVVRRRGDGQIEDVTPQGYNARTRVHEYGGGSFCVADGVVYFSNFADQRLYRQGIGGEPQPLTPSGYRYADGMVDRARNRIVLVREDHTEEGKEAVNTIVAIDPEAEGPGVVLVSGADFYSTPRLSPNGRYFSWVQWNHPEMPWTSSSAWMAEVREDGSLGQPQQVAGGSDESVFQPSWSPANELYFVSDRSGWWNLYRWENGKAMLVVPMAAEFGQAQWVFGLSTYSFATESLIICAYVLNGDWNLARLDAGSGVLTTLDVPYTAISLIQANAKRAVFMAGQPDAPSALVMMEIATGKIEPIRRSTMVHVDARYLSHPQMIEYPTTGGKKAYAVYYPPHNEDFAAPQGEKPPLIVISHGGPTSAATATFSLEISYWTSRGFAVLDVNYGGSTGYGREYRQRLDGQWGIVDVDDCTNGALYLASRGEVDGQRLIIRGGSAGGYTTLAALTFRNEFRAGASYFGVSDLEALAKETHKFESRYLDGLIGPYPERQDLYVQRSPIHHVGRLECPIIFFQGLEDKIVLPNQAEMMVDALRQKELPVAYLAFPGEQHGFRQAQNIKRTLEAELYFYARIFGLAVPQAVEPIQIENLEE